MIKLIVIGAIAIIGSIVLSALSDGSYESKDDKK